MTVRELASSATDRLKRARVPDPRREAESLLAHALGKDAAWIVGHADDAVRPPAAKAYAAMVARRARHEPFAHVVGERWFYGRKFRVTKDVLIPRPETELLIEAVLAVAPKGAATIVDIGAGSGAIGLTLAAELPRTKAVLYDVSKRALDVVARNARALKLGRRARGGRLDIFRRNPPEPEGDAVVAANLPYLPPAAWKKAAPEVRLREPKLALVSGSDGLRHYRALFKRLARWRRRPAVLAIEAEPGQFPELRRMASALMPDADIAVLKDLHGDDRVLVASERKRPVA